MTEPPGASVPPLERAVMVMDRLRSPGGCPWDAEQTHESLARYLVEECYEVLEAIETGDLALLREELGDLLLQVLFHARLAQERSAGEAFGIDEVAGDLVDKLVRRHPHVFATDGAAGETSAGPRDADSLNAAWELQKIREKGRTSAVDGVPPAQPALALAAKLVSRAERAGIASAVLSEITSEITSELASESAGATTGATQASAAQASAAQTEDELGRTLLAVVQQAVSAGIDPEGALRRMAGRYRRAVRHVEAQIEPGHEEPVR